MTRAQPVFEALRQLSIELPSWAFGNSGHPVQGVRAAGRAAHPVGEDRPTPRRCTGSPASPRGGAAHPVGQGRRLCGAGARTPPSSGSAIGTINSNVFQDDDYKLGSVCQPRPASAPQGHRPPARVRRHHGRDRVARPEALVRRRHQLPRPGRHPRPGRTGWPRRCARSTRGCGDDQRMLLEYKLFEPSFYTHRRAGLGHRAAALPGARRPRRRSSWTPGTTRPAPTSSSSWRMLLRPGRLGGVRLQLAASTPTTT